MKIHGIIWYASDVCCRLQLSDPQHETRVARATCAACSICASCLGESNVRQRLCSLSVAHKLRNSCQGIRQAACSVPPCAQRGLWHSFHASSRAPSGVGGVGRIHVVEIRAVCCEDNFDNVVVALLETGADAVVAPVWHAQWPKYPDDAQWGPQYNACQLDNWRMVQFILYTVQQDLQHPQKEVVGEGEESIKNSLLQSHVN